MSGASLLPLYPRGLVVGKFAPLHRGHELVIRRAMAVCGAVYIISWSKPEMTGSEPDRRTAWLERLFPAALRLVLTDVSLAALDPPPEFASSPLTTLFYSRQIFSNAEPALVELAARAYDLTILCTPDIPLVDDGTRHGDVFRSTQDAWYRRELAARQVSYVVTRGSVEERVGHLAGLIGRSHP